MRALVAAVMALDAESADVHRMTAAKIFAKSKSERDQESWKELREVTTEERMSAQVVNFGRLYAHPHQAAW